MNNKCRLQTKAEKDNSNWMNILREELFQRRRYDPHVRPVRNHEDENNVDMQFSITRVHINEKEGILETNGWLGLVATTSITTTLIL